MHHLNELAKKAVEKYIKTEKIILPSDNFPEKYLKRKSGVFVTITENNQLRGCIGTYLPIKENIAEEIINNAIAAATEDYRFGPIQKEKLAELSYEVYILDEPEQIQSLNELDPKKYGIIVKTVPESKSDLTFIPKSVLLLPDLENIDTVKKQFETACKKGGINPSKEKITFYKFEAKKYK